MIGRVEDSGDVCWRTEGVSEGGGVVEGEPW